MHPSKVKNQLKLHLVVFIFGFTGILGKLIETTAIPLVWYRMFIGAVAILGFLLHKKRKLKLPIKDVLMLLGVGVIIAAHWITFFHAIDISNVSVALATISSTAFFVSFLEPLFFKRRIIPYELLFGFLAIAGVYVIFKVEGDYRNGVLVALISAFLAALFSVLNAKILRKKIRPNVITFYEMLGGFLVISVYMLFKGDINYSLFTVPNSDWVYIIILGTICTAYAFIAIVEIMEVLSPYTVALSINLEPVYAIVIAYFYFDERMDQSFYLGAILIIATVFGNAWMKRKLKNESEGKGISADT